MEPMYKGESLWPPMKVVTKEEFESLSSGERQSGIYAIPGGNADTASSSEIYSTEEQVVGRWIDGKPIYRKCLDLQVSALQFTVTPPAHDKLTSVRFTTYGSIEFFDNMARTNTDVCRCWYNRNENLIYVQTSADFSITRIVLILEYTKITDPEVSA